jgi:hypothetical protein
MNNFFMWRNDAHDGSQMYMLWKQWPTNIGHVITQAVSSRLTATAVWVQCQIRSCGLFGRTKWHWGRFAPSTSVSLDNSHSILSPGAGTISQLVVDVPNGLSYPTPRKQQKNLPTYYYVFMVPCLKITRFRLDVWIYQHFLYNLLDSQIIRTR